MSHFYGSMQGMSKEKTTRGSVNSGLETHTRGWDLGIKIKAVAFGATDCFKVYATGGSNNPSEVLIGHLLNGVFTLKLGVKNPMGRKIKVQS